MENSEKPIAVIEPFGQAVEITKQVLFSPFDLGRWFVIGFAAWLAAGRSGFGFLRFANLISPGTPSGKSFNMSPAPSWAAAARSIHSAPPIQWTPGLIIIWAVVGCLVLAISLALLWFHCRGQFIFLDAIVQNRAAIVEPWKRLKREGNDLFIFLFVAGLASIVTYLMLAAFAVVLFSSAWRENSGAGIIEFLSNDRLPVFFFIMTCAVVVLFWLSIFLVIPDFIVPVMYRNRCSTVEAFRMVFPLLVKRFWVFFLFSLFQILVGLGAGALTIMLVCVTCCLAAIPYIGTVILLPIAVCLRSYPLCFLKQFGPEFDVFAAAAPPETPPPEPPAAPSMPELAS